MKNTWISCFYIIAFKDGARGNLCRLMKEEESEQRVTAEEREKPLHSFEYKIKAKYKW